MRNAKEKAQGLVKKNVTPESVAVVTAAVTAVTFVGCQFSSLLTGDTDSCAMSSLRNNALPGATLALLSGVVANPEKALEVARHAKTSAEQAVAYLKQHGVKESAKNAAGGALALGSSAAHRVSGMIWGKPVVKADTASTTPGEDNADKPKLA